MSLSSKDGFTPVVDTLVKEHGLVTAVVFGAVWRYCQMQEKVCRASLEVIGDRLGLDKATVKRHINTLCDNGYLKDLTPGKRNAPHVYIDTGKVEITGSIQDTPALESHTKRGQTVADDNSYIMEETGQTVEENNSSKETVADDNSLSQTVAENNATVVLCNATVAENRLKIDSKIPSKIEESIITSAKKPKKPKPPRQLTEKESASRAMFKALADLCQYDIDIISKELRGALNQTEAILRNKGATPADLERFGIWWYANDWRGKQGQSPRPNQVRESWRQFENSQKGVQPNGHETRYKIPTVDQAAYRHLEAQNAAATNTGTAGRAGPAASRDRPAE